jgi:hypothetical protein
VLAVAAALLATTFVRLLCAARRGPPDRAGRHLRHRRSDEEVREQIYFPQRQVRRSPLASVVRTRHLPEATATVKAAVERLDPPLPVYDMRPLDDYLARATSVRRFTATLGAAGLALGVAGAAAGARLLQSQLYAVGPYAVWTYFAAIGVLALAIGAPDALRAE